MQAAEGAHSIDLTAPLYRAAEQSGAVEQEMVATKNGPLISLADRNELKNLPRQIFSACVKFGGNPCRDVDTSLSHTHTHTHTHTHE